MIVIIIIILVVALVAVALESKPQSSKNWYKYSCDILTVWQYKLHTFALNVPVILTVWNAYANET